MRRSVVPVLVSLLLLASSAPALAQGQPVTPDWKIYSYAPSGRTLTSHHADATSAGLAAFTFLTTPDDALLAIERPEGPHVSILGRTITATIAISAPGATFQYFGEGTPQNPCGTPASARLYFNTNGAFGFGTNNDWFSKFWWSNPVASTVLADGTVTLTATVDPANWSNWNGQPGTLRQDGFAAAASDPDLIGFSFGGGCFFENGVGATGAPATFTLQAFEIK